GRRPETVHLSSYQSAFAYRQQLVCLLAITGFGLPAASFSVTNTSFRPPPDVRSHGGLGADARRPAPEHLRDRLLCSIHQIFSREPAGAGGLARHYFLSRVPIEGNGRGLAGVVSALLLFRAPQNEGAETDQSLLRVVADRRRSVVLFALCSSCSEGRL